MRQGHTRFLVAISALCVLVLVATWVIVSSDTLYCRHSTVFWDATDCYKFSVHDEASDVVFVGDSSLVFGVRPNLIADQLHLTAFNLGLPAGSLIFFPGMLLDRYLAHNRRPRLIVLYVSPWTLLDDQKDITQLWNDGARVAIRHGSLAQLFGIFADDPRRVIQFPAIFLKQGWRQFSLSGQWWREASSEMRAERGWFAIWRPGRSRAILRPGGPFARPVSLADRCTLTIKPLVPNRLQIRRFREAYQHAGIRVVIYVAPVPRCDPSYPAIVAAYAGIADNLPRTLPGRYFVDDGWRVHMTRDGADQATAQVVDFIRSTILSSGGDPAAPDASIANNHS